MLSFLVLLFFKFTESNFSESSFRTTIRVTNNSEPDQARRLVGPDLGSNCLQKLSADVTKKIKSLVLFGFLHSDNVLKWRLLQLFVAF